MSIETTKEQDIIIQGLLQDYYEGRWDDKLALSFARFMLDIITGEDHSVFKVTVAEEQE